MRPAGVLLVLVVVLLLAACGGSGASESFKEGRTIYGDYCSVCHGSAGEGGVGPSLDGVLTTWPDCDGQVRWVALGSERWKAEHGDTYGATDNPITAVMPEHEGRLTLEQIRRVAAFERIQYGGQPEAEAMTDCKVE